MWVWVSVGCGTAGVCVGGGASLIPSSPDPGTCPNLHSHSTTVTQQQCMYAPLYRHAQQPLAVTHTCTTHSGPLHTHMHYTLWAVTHTCTTHSGPLHTHALHTLGRYTHTHALHTLGRYTHTHMHYTLWAVTHTCTTHSGPWRDLYTRTHGRGHPAAAVNVCPPTHTHMHNNSRSRPEPHTRTHGRGHPAAAEHPAPTARPGVGVQVRVCV